jgi:Fe-S cluster biosynthesis and repair protein YggX
VTYSRADIQEFCNKTWKSWRRRQILLIRPHKVFMNLLRDAELMFLFAMALLRAEPDSQATPGPAGRE